MKKINLFLFLFFLIVGDALCTFIPKGNIDSAFKSGSYDEALPKRSTEFGRKPLERLKTSSLRQRLELFKAALEKEKRLGQLDEQEYQFFKRLVEKANVEDQRSFWANPEVPEFQNGILEAYNAAFPNKYPNRKYFIQRNLLGKCSAFGYKIIGYDFEEESGDIFEKIGPSEPFPELVLKIDIRKPHTLDVKKYLENRLSRAIVLGLKNAEFIDIFIGTERQLLSTYSRMPLVGIPLTRKTRKDGVIVWVPDERGAVKEIVKLGSPISNSFYSFSLRGEMDKIKSHRTLMVIGDVGGQSRLTDLILRFKFLGIDLEKIRIWGNFENLLAKDKNIYSNYIRSKAVKPKILIMGPRWDVVQYFVKYAERSPDYKVTSEEGEWFGDSNDKSLDNVFKLNYQEMIPERPGVKPFAVLSAKMPNGDLAGRFVKLAMENGIKIVVAAGAGGSLTDRTPVGGLQVFESASLGAITITAPRGKMVTISSPFNAGSFSFLPNGKNITVVSPLEENRAWLDFAQRNYTVVDVESFHILKAFNDFVDKAKCVDCKILPTLFISDLVGPEPLEEKISPANAWKGLGQFLDVVVSTFKEELTQ